MTMNDLNETQNSNFKYKIKHCQKRKESFSSMKEKKFKIKTEKKH